MKLIPRPLLLMILDGWGESPASDHNAICQASTTNFCRLRTQYPYTELKTDGESVGLPAGQMGNSEVGHLNIGAGRVVYQDLTRIDRSIRTGEIFTNPVLRQAMAHARQGGKALHLLGLVSDGGVHSQLRHLFALLEMARREGLTEVYVHALLDGRDVPPSSALEYFAQLEAEMQRLQLGRVATVSGRYYGMDRDKRWERVERYYQMLVLGQGLTAASAEAAVTASYQRGETDEFVQPTVIVDADGRPVATVADGDAVICFNFRTDRAREITRALVDREFTSFHRPFRPELFYVCMTQYDATIDAPVAFPPEELRNTLGQVLAAHGRRQLRIAETEKYAHVTFFFNGGEEEPNPGEDRILIPSPKVPTYDLQPEMSAYAVTEKVIEAIASEQYDVIVLNYANADMVGHTGLMTAAIVAVNTVDDCLGRVTEAVLARGGAVLITADHGNADEMAEPGGHGPHTAHTNSPAPFLLVYPPLQAARLRSAGGLEDIAPTMLELLGIPKPDEMTGRSLLESDEKARGVS